MLISPQTFSPLFPIVEPGSRVFFPLDAVAEPIPHRPVLTQKQAAKRLALPRRKKPKKPKKPQSRTPLRPTAGLPEWNMTPAEIEKRFMIAARRA